eukprot:1687259-Rhodomonas_salina.2
MQPHSVDTLIKVGFQYCMSESNKRSKKRADESTHERSEIVSCMHPDLRSLGQQVFDGVRNPRTSVQPLQHRACL